MELLLPVDYVVADRFEGGESSAKVVPLESNPNPNPNLHPSPNLDLNPNPNPNPKQVVPLDQIPDGWLGLDHGPESTAAIRSALDGCRTVLWNGPMGVFEQPAYAKVGSE